MRGIDSRGLKWAPFLWDNGSYQLWGNFKITRYSDEFEVEALGTLLDLLEHDERATAIVDAATGVRFTYGQLREEITQLRASLPVSRGDRVVVCLPNGIDIVALFFAITDLGAAAVHVNPAYTPDEMAYATEHCGAKLVIRDQQSWDQQSWERRHPAGTTSASPDDPALYIYTSGATNRPKGVPLTHRNLLAATRNFATAFFLTSADRTLNVMPPFHVHGFIGSTLSTLAVGGTVVMSPKFSAHRFWSDAKEHEITWYTASPTIHQIALTRAQEDRPPLPPLRFIRSSSAKLPERIRLAMEQTYGCPVLESYGMTEAANQVAATPLPPAERKSGSVGLPAGTEVAILGSTGEFLPPGETGEVVIRGENLMPAYDGNTEANIASFLNGWFRTGDQGFLDRDGYLFINGRIKDLIIRGGENISPLEVDEILCQHPAVAEAVCFGVSDEKYGEEIHAAVVLNSDATESEIIAFCAARLSPFKIPKKINFTDALPRTATNKVQRHIVALAFRPS